VFMPTGNLTQMRQQLSALDSAIAELEKFQRNQPDNKPKRRAAAHRARKEPRAT